MELIDRIEISLMLDDRDYLEFLQDITKCGGVLSHPANNIAKIVADGKFRDLTPKQRNVYAWYVYKPIKKQRHCRRCRVKIPWRDMFNSLASGNLCRKCRDIRAKYHRN